MYIWTSCYTLVPNTSSTILKTSEHTNFLFCLNEIKLNINKENYLENLQMFRNKITYFYMTYRPKNKSKKY